MNSWESEMIPPGREGREGLDAAVALFHGLSDPTRLAITRRLAHGEARVVDLTRQLGLPQSTISSHLACLRDCGIVVAEMQGRKVRYDIADHHLRDALTSLVEVTLAVNDAAPCPDPACSDSACQEVR